MLVKHLFYKSIACNRWLIRLWNGLLIRLWNGVNDLAFHLKLGDSVQSRPFSVYSIKPYKNQGLTQDPPKTGEPVQGTPISVYPVKHGTYQDSAQVTPKSGEPAEPDKNQGLTQLRPLSA